MRSSGSNLIPLSCTRSIGFEYTFPSTTSTALNGSKIYMTRMPPFPLKSSFQLCFSGKNTWVTFTAKLPLLRAFGKLHVPYLYFGMLVCFIRVAGGIGDGYIFYVLISLFSSWGYIIRKFNAKLSSTVEIGMKVQQNTSKI